MGKDWISRKEEESAGGVGGFKPSHPLSNIVGELLKSSTFTPTLDMASLISFYVLYGCYYCCGNEEEKKKRGGWIIEKYEEGERLINRRKRR